ncbi:hypothetical protein GCM10025787_19500 [Saccharopolyspora rosea]|uniref:AMP-binding protein n=1 Tax=Saccharopolyspora rosea TaxID=524884 RepID=A0ABW3FXC1_9PSEU
MSVLPILGGPPVSRVFHGERVLTGDELAAEARHAARLLPRGSRIALTGDDALARLCWFLGADLAGSAALLVEPSWADRERRAVLADARPDASVEVRRLAGSARPVEPVGDESTPFYLPTTSGSSGRPRVLIRSRGSWLRSFALLDLGLRADDRVLVPGPLTSSLFLFGALHALHAGAEVQLLDRWSAAEAARACRTATVVHLVPAMLSALLSAVERDPALRAACRLRTVVCAGSRVDPALAERLASLLPGCALVEYYGSAEQSLVAVRTGGALRPVVEVRIDDTGTLWARSDLGVDGHLVDGRVVPPEERDGWTTVGDRGVLHPDGTLEVLGRPASAIDSGAKIVGAEEVEAALRGVDGVLDVLVSATPHPRFGALVTALVEALPGEPPALAALRARAREALEPGKRPHRWLVTERLPRTASGKPARALVAEHLREGTLDAVEMS